MRRVHAGVLLVGMLAVAACEQATIVQPEFAPTFQPPNLSVNDPQAETVTLGNVDTLYGGASDTTSQQKAVPYVTIMKVTGSYTVSVMKNRYPVSDPSPAVLYARHGLGITIKSGTSSSNVAFSGTTDGELSMFLTLGRNDRISRAYHAGGTNGSQSGTWPNDGSPWQCGTQYSDPCYKYVGAGGSVSITPLQGALVLNADSTTVSIGSSVKFWIDSSLVEGKSLGIEVDSANWLPDSEAEGGEASQAQKRYACIFSGWPLTCTKEILGSGTLEVIAHVNGFRKVQTQHISVREGVLTLTADRPNVAQGDTVTFTPKWSDGAPIQIHDWKFIPDSGTDVTGGCPSYMTICKRSIKQSGTMRVRVSRNTKIRSAHAHVHVIPCPTHDPILDHPNVRKAIDSLFKLADVNGASPVERWMEAFDSLGTIVVRIAPVNPNYDNLCGVYKYPDLQGPGSKVASFHVHPVAPLDALHCPSEDDPGVATDKFGGPSEQDWQSRRGQTVPEYVINPIQIQRMDLPPDEAEYWEERRGGDKIVRKYPTENVKNFVRNHARTVNGCSRY